MKFLSFIFFISIFYLRLMFAQQVLWQHLGLDKQDVLSIKVDYEGNLFVGTADSGIYKSTNSGSRWIHLSLPFSRVDAIAVDKDSSILAGGNNGLFKSTDGGVMWQKLNLPERSQINFIYISPLDGIFTSVLNINDTTGGLVFQSIDNGKNWINITNGLTNTLMLSFCSLPNGQMLAGSDVGRLYIDKLPPNEWFFYGGIHKSIDNGSQWLSFGLDRIAIASIICLSNNNILLGSYWNGIFLSTDEGNIWKESNGGLNSLYQKNIRSVLLPPNDKIYIATLGGIFVSNNYGANWIPLNNGLADTNALSIALDSFGFLYAGTCNGIFRSVRPITKVNGEENMPSKFSLNQNYPNPFNPTTTIGYQLPMNSKVSLKIYDILGREIATLVNEVKSEGTYNVPFNGSSLSSGIYFYRLQSGNYVETKKLVLMK